MQFLVIEHFKDGDARPAYRRFNEKGRQCPDGLDILNSWVDAGFGRCFLLMECDDAALLQKWSAAWSDLVDIEIIPVVTTKDAAEAVAPYLGDD